MRIIELDARAWATPLDFLAAMRRAIGAPEAHGLDIDALVASMIRSGQPPMTIRVSGTVGAASSVKTEIESLTRALDEARTWRNNHRYDAVAVAIEVVA
jgi:hypothetical protein